MEVLHLTECGLTNLATCLPEMLFSYFVSILNAALQGVLDVVYAMMTSSVNVSLFEPLWQVMVYVLSLFYGLFLLSAGFNFMISGYNASKRENAKAWIANIFFMVLSVQASYFLYDTMIGLAGTLTGSVINIIDPDFFLVNTSNFASVGLELVYVMPYLSILVFTMLLLGLRYIFLLFGVLFVPFAAFFYFIPPLRSYGKLILNVLLVLAFVPFFMAITLFGVSKMSSLLMFGGNSILAASLGFLAIDLMLIIATVFAIIKAAFGVLGTDVGRVAKAAVKFLV